MKRNDKETEEDIIQDIETLESLKFVEDDFFLEINQQEVSDGTAFKLEELAREHDKLVYNTKLSFADFYSRNYERLTRKEGAEETPKEIEDLEGHHVSDEELSPDSYKIV